MKSENTNLIFFLRHVSEDGHSFNYFKAKIKSLVPFLTKLLRVLSIKTCIMKNKT